MDFKQIRIEKRECGYWVAVDDKAAICLDMAEALGCVASAMFGPGVIFARTKEEERAFHLEEVERELSLEEWAEFLAFLGLPFEPLEKANEELTDGK